jgi:hypothetical protein
MSGAGKLLDESEGANQVYKHLLPNAPGQSNLRHYQPIGMHASMIQVHAGCNASRICTCLHSNHAGRRPKSRVVGRRAR